MFHIKHTLGKLASIYWNKTVIFLVMLFFGVGLYHAVAEAGCPAGVPVVAWWPSPLGSSPGGVAPTPEGACELFFGDWPREFTFTNENAGDPPGLDCFACSSFYGCPNPYGSSAFIGTWARTQPVCEKYILTVPVESKPVDNLKSCPKEGNPISVLTGVKTQREVDYTGSNSTPLLLARYYNSKTAAKDASSEWLNNYSSKRLVKISAMRSIDEYIEEPEVLQSKKYDTPEGACIGGWAEIGGRSQISWAASSTASYEGGNCVISSTVSAESRTYPLDAYYGNYFIDPAAKYLAVGPIEPTVQIRRDNGSVYTFYYINGKWTNTASDSQNILEEIYTDGVQTGWKYTTADNTVEHYTLSGKLASITNRLGLTQTLTYDASQKLERVSDTFGRELTFAYTSDGKLQSVTDPAGKTISYQYDAINNLASVTYPDDTPSDPTDDPVRTYLYENTDFPHALTGIIDENGNRFATWSYDTKGRAVSSEHAGGVERVDLVFNEDGSTTATEADGAQRTYQFETVAGGKRLSVIEGPCLTCGSTTLYNEYNNNGTISRRIDFNGNVTEYTYNDRGLEQSRTEAVGTYQERTITTQWHPSFNLPTLITEADKTTAYSYDANGLVLSRTETDIATGEARSWSYTYNTFGQIESVDGPRTDVADITSYSYDPATGNLLSSTNALGHVTQVTAHDASGRPLTIVDPNGVTTQLTYDARGRLRSQSRGGLITTFDYDAVGNITSITLPDGSYMDYGYDPAHRLTTISDNLGNTIHYTLDLTGNRTKTEINDTSGTLTYTHDQVFNELRRLIESVDAHAQSTYYDYDAVGNLVGQTDANSNYTSFAFDALNRLQQTTDAMNGITEYGYDAQDHLTQVIDPDGNITKYKYDGFGNLLQLTSPDTGITSYQYDEAGNLLQQTDANGQTTYYQYDALNRLMLALYSDGSSTEYHYDSGANGIGRLSQLIDSGNTLQWQYDGLGHVIQKDQIIGSLTLTTLYHYNSAGRLDQMTYPSGAVVDYEYSAGKLNRLLLNGAALISDVQYQPFGGVTQWIWGNGSLSQRQYDLAGQLMQETLGADTRTIAYDPVGNISALTDTAYSANFSYDALSRLTNVLGGVGDESLSYDDNGNRQIHTTNTTTRTFDIAADSNRLLGIAGDVTASMEYDARGNTKYDDRHSYGYDSRQRLTVVDYSNVRYGYNGLNQRVAKWFNVKNGTTIPGDANDDGVLNNADLAVIVSSILGTASAPGDADCNSDAQINVQDIVCLNVRLSTAASVAGHTDVYYAYDEQGQLIGEYNTAGSAQQETIWFGSIPIATLQGGSVYYIHTDHLDTPRVITASTDASNTALWRWNSNAFGSTAADEDADGDGIKLTYNLRFPGQYYDAETGLHYNAARYYDPSTGRYITSDPIGLKGGLNTYAYVGGNPLRFSDPLGLAPLQCADNDREEQCDQLHEIDTQTCNAITRARGPQAGAACHASASLRYAACLRGQSLPPLNTWNNFEGTEPEYPDSTESPNIPTPPWWIIPLLPFITIFSS